MADENLSGVPPSVTLSGLNAGAPSIGGTSQPGMSGAPGQGGGMLPGMEGGMDLATLMQMLQSGETPGVSSAGSIGQPLTAGTFGQQQGGLGAGSLGQSQPGYVAGQSSMGPNPAQQAAVGSPDPFSILQKIFGVAQKGAGALGGGAGTASPVAGSDLALNTDLGGMSGAGSPSTAGTASPTIASDQQGMLGNPLLQDPTISNLFTTGKLNGWDGSQESLIALMQTDPAIAQAFSQGGEPGMDLGQQLASGQGAGGFTLGTGPGAPGDTNWGGAGMGAVTGATGLLNLLNSLQSGNASGAAGGGLQAAGGLLGLLKSSPALANALGLGSGVLSGAGDALGGLGGLLSLYQGIQSGNPMQIGSGVLGTAQGASTLSGALGGATITDALASVAPEAMNAIVAAVGGPAATAASEAALAAGATAGEALSASISAIAAAYALPVAAVVQIITDTLGEQDRQRIQNSGFLNNPIKGALYSGATQGVGNVNDMLSKNGDLSGVSTDELGRMLSYGANNLLPYYATAQGGREAIRASDTITGRGEATSSKPYMGGETPDQYTANFTKAQGGLSALVNELMGRGVTYEQLGSLPITGDWAQQSLDVSDPLQQLYQGGAQKYNTEAQQLLTKAGTSGRQYIDPGEVNQMAAAGLNPATFGYGQDEQGRWFKSPYGNATPEQLFQAALGSSQIAPESKTHASGDYTSMFGGPLWAMMARMGAGGPQTQQMIQQHFDPWVNLRNSNAEQLGTSLMPILQSAAFRQQYDTGAGG